MSIAPTFASLKSTSNDNVQLDDSLRYLEHTIGAPFTQGNRVDVLKNGTNIFPAMLDAIREAKHSILFETYVYWTGDVAVTFSDALAEKAKAGVTVRVLLDSHGSSRMNKDQVKKMEDAGVLLKWFRPLRLRVWDYDKRTHRKILVCDNEVGFTGGVGIAKEWEGDARNPNEWRETHFRIRGRSVPGLTGAFWNNWIDIEGERLPEPEKPLPLEQDGDSLIMTVRSSPATHQSEMELVFESLILIAKESITLTTPYFNIRSSTVELLKLKAEEGVSIKILLPGKHIDKRMESFVADECLEKLIDVPNISLFRYQRSMIHTKIIRVDNSICCVGSPNFNQRSRKKDFEVALIISDQTIAQTLDAHFEDDLTLSAPLEKESIQRPNILKKALQKMFMLFKEQL